MEAARLLRRAPAGAVVPALSAAARSHTDEYVRYRALVLLSGFAEPGTGVLMRSLLSDRNDRIRSVAYAWFEHHPDPAILPALVAALSTEGSEFVRPALTRAIAAFGDDARARDALVPLVARGEDYFRGALIDALGDYRASYALPAIEAVARLDGPLQDDAISAIGKIGEAGQLVVIVGLQETVPEALQPTVSASLCLLGLNCDRHKAFIVESLKFAAASGDRQPVLRGAVHALGLLAVRGHEDALLALLAAGAGADAGASGPIALGVGLVALRDPDLLLRVLARQQAPEAGVLLLRDAFDMLSEDFEEERFYVAIRRAYWAAADGTAERRTAEALIRVLEF
jgi:HEAT repeat protein